MKILLISTIVALFLTASASAHFLKTNRQQPASPEAKISYWKQQRQHAVRARAWIRHHPDGYTFKRWTRLLRDHSWLARVATKKIELLRWQTKPPHYYDWLCIHRFEGSWKDSGDPYWGGLQMNREFMRSYAPRRLLLRGWANSWTPREQMWVAERAHSRGRGFGPWPNTAAYCHLL